MDGYVISVSDPDESMAALSQTPALWRLLQDDWRMQLLCAGSIDGKGFPHPGL
jgi:hypothetical protein